MNNKKAFKAIFTLLITLTILMTNDLFSQLKKIPYKIIELENVSRYNEDRVAYQHVQFDVPEFKISSTDNSVACLLICKNRRMYLFIDGYDNAKNAQLKKTIFAVETRTISNNELWVNIINSIPDFARIMDRRIEILIKVDKVKGKSGDADKDAKTKQVNTDFVSKNFQKLFLNVRNEFLKRHVEKIKTLIDNRQEALVSVKRKPLPDKLIIGVPEMPIKYYTCVTAKAVDTTLYFAEDSDGDGITETFTVHIPDGFHWGFKSGPNVIFIYNNKVKAIQDIIGNITNNAYYGTDEEAKNIKDQMKDKFPKDDDPKKVREWIDQLGKFH